MPAWEMNFEPNVMYDGEIFDLWIQIEAEKRAAMEIPLPPAMRKKINTLNILRQIQSTTAIEGNTLKEEEIEYTLKEEEDNPDKEFNQEEREVINANKALSYIKEHATQNTDGIITEELIKKIHYIMTLHCDYPENVPGEYRKVPVHAGEFSAPLPKVVNDRMKSFLILINDMRLKELRNPVMRAVIAHFYLVTIHPFRDGNGRTSRALEAYLLYHSGYNVNSFYSLANFYYKNRFEYVQKLQEARFTHNGNLTEFVKFALKGYLSEMQYIRKELIRFVKVLAFKDMLVEYKDVSEIITDRQFEIMRYLTSFGTSYPYVIFDLKTIPYKGFVKKNHELSAKLYSDLKERTILRDLKHLSKEKLIWIDSSKQISANLSIMDEYMV